MWKFVIAILCTTLFTLSTNAQVFSDSNYVDMSPNYTILKKDATIETYDVLKGKFIVPNGITLTIKKNSVIKFMDDSELIIHGSLIAVSSIDTPIILKGFGERLWNGVSFMNGSLTDSSVLKNVYIESRKSKLGIDQYDKLDTRNVTLEKRAFTKRQKITGVIIGGIVVTLGVLTTMALYGLSQAIPPVQ